ncbi:MAG: cytochrome c oxidase assembly protein [Alphaproteobacteria bacterium]|nr:cytochrome c oxidase assembly protein [Alphaproteobacteria bacterium]
MATRNGRTALALGGVAAVMVGLSFAAVPLYRLFCQVTGFAGTPLRADRPSDAAVADTIVVRFSATVQSQLPWTFAPEVPSLRLPIGENALVSFRAHNLAAQPLVGTATFNVTPEKAAPYFAKVQCFCFSEQRLAAGETVEMPVAFYVDPAILQDPGTRDLKTITLSYTFFRAADARDQRVAAPAASRTATN